MSSQLQAQLRSIAHASVPTHLAPKARRSVLFERDQADDVDAESVRKMALEACEELEAADERFARGKKILFGHAVEDDKELLQKHIAEFLRLLAPYYARPAADKVMEHLVRSKEAWFRCADDVLACVLPFHATERFAKVLRAIDLTHSSWRCLKLTQKNRTHLTRGRIVQLAAQDRAAFQFLCREVKEAAHIARTGTGAVASFYAVTLVETMQIMPEESIQRYQVVHLVIQFVAGVLQQKKASVEAVAAVFMVAAQLTSKVSLEREVSDALLELVGKGAPQLLQVQAVYLMAHIAYTQREQVQELNEKSFNHLVKFHNIVDVMGGLASGSKKGLSLVRLFLFRLVDNAALKSKQAEMLVKLVGTVDVGDLAGELVHRLAQKALSCKAEGYAVAIYVDLLKELETKHPLQVDATVQKLLDEDNESGKLFEFFSEVFQGSVLQPMQDTKVSSLTALSSPKGKLRVAALKRLDAEMEQLCIHTKLHDLVSDAVVKALQDEKVDVVRAALSTNFLRGMEIGTVYDLLCQRFLSTMVSLKNSTSADVSRDLQICCALIRFLADHYGQYKADKQSDVLHLLLNNVLIHPRTVKVNLLCIYLATKVEQKLEPLRICSEEGAHEEIVQSPGKRNQRIVQELSKAPYFQESFGMLYQSARQHNLCSLELLTSLALNAFLSKLKNSKHQENSTLTLAFEFIGSLQKRLNIGSKLPLGPGIWQEGLPPENFWDWEQSEPGKAGLVLWKELLLSFLRCLPTRSLPWESTFLGTTAREMITTILSFPAIDALREHIDVLFLATRDSRTVLLGQIVTLHPKEAPLQARANALALLLDTYQNGPKVKDMCETEEFVRQTAPALLVALCAPEQLVRKRAIECCKAAAQLNIPSRTNELKKKSCWKELLLMLGKISEKQVDILHDPEGLLKGMRKKAYSNSSEVSQFVLTAAVTGKSSHCKRILLRVSRVLLKDSEVLSATVELFGSISAGAMIEQSQEWALLRDLLQLYTVDNISALNDGMQEQCYQNIVSACRVPEDTEDVRRTQHIRCAVLKSITPQLVTSAPLQTQLALLENMLDVLIKDPSEQCHTLCKQFFNLYNVPDDHIVHFLNVYPEGRQGEERTRKKTKVGHEDDGSVEVNNFFQKKVKESVAMLEIMQWKQGSFNTSAEVVRAICYLMKHLLANPDHEDSAEGDEIEFEIPADYCLKLCITVLHQCAEADNIHAINVDVVFQCAKQTLDKNLRRSSLKLLATLSDKNPDMGLHHALDALKVASTSILRDSDQLSFEVAHMVIQAAIPAFAKKGKDVKEVVEIVLQSLSHVAEHRRGYIMSALWHAMERDEDRKVFFGLFMRELVKKEQTWARGDAAQLLEKIDPLLVMEHLVSMETDQKKNIAELQEVVSLLTSIINALLLEGGEESDRQKRLSTICSSVISFCVVSIQAVERMSKTSPHQSKDSPQGKVRESLWSLVTLVSNARSPEIHAACLLDFLSTGKIEEQKTVLRVLAHTSEVFESAYGNGSQRDASPVIKVVEALNAMLIRDGKERNVSSLYNPVLSVLWHLITLYGERTPEIALYALAGELHVIDQGETTPSTAAIQCLAQGVKKAGRAFIPKIPEFMPRLLDQLAAVSKQLSTDRAVEHNASLLGKAVALLEALEVCIEHLGPLLTPYISKMAEIALSPVLINSKDEELAGGASRVFVSIPNHVPARIALPTILALYSAVEGLGDESLEVYYLVLEQVVRRLDKHEIRVHHVSIFAGLLQGFDVRRTAPSSIKHCERAEASCARVCLELVKRLNDSQFSPLLERLMEWAEATGVPCDTSHAHTARIASMFHLVSVLSSSLKAVFAPYYAVFFDELLGSLKAAGSAQKSAKRRKVDEEEGKGEWEMRYYALHALHNCFLHDDGVVMNQERFEMAMPVIVSQCMFMPDPIDGSEVSREQMDMVVANCIVQLAVLMGDDSLWKPMNHKLLMHTRNERAHTRFLALKSIKKMVERLQEEYLIFLPETLPFLAELLEDSHSKVENTSKEIIRLLEQVSGEDLEQYLKGG